MVMDVTMETSALGEIPADVTRAVRNPVCTVVFHLLHARNLELMRASALGKRGSTELGRFSVLKAQRINAVLRELGLHAAMCAARVDLSESGQIDETNETSIKCVLRSWRACIAEGDTEHSALLDRVARALCFDAKHLVHLFQTAGPARALEYLCTFVGPDLMLLEEEDGSGSMTKGMLRRILYMLHKERMRSASAHERERLVADERGVHQLLRRAFDRQAGSFTLQLQGLARLENGTSVPAEELIREKLLADAQTCPALSECTLDGDHRLGATRAKAAAGADAQTCPALSECTLDGDHRLGATRAKAAAAGTDPGCERAPKRARMGAPGAFAHASGLALCEVRPPPPPTIAYMPDVGVRELVFLDALPDPPEYIKRGAGADAHVGVCALHEHGELLLYMLKDPAHASNWSAWCAGGRHGAVDALCPAPSGSRAEPPIRGPADPAHRRYKGALLDSAPHRPHAICGRPSKSLFMLKHGRVCAHFSLVTSSKRKLSFLGDIFGKVDGRARIDSEADRRSFGDNICNIASGALCIANGGKSQWIFVTARCVRTVQLVQISTTDNSMDGMDNLCFAAKEAPHRLGEGVERCAIEPVDPAEAAGDSVYMALVAPTRVQIMRVDRMQDGKFTVVPTECVHPLPPPPAGVDERDEPARVLAAEWRCDDGDRVLVVVTTDTATAFTLAPEYSEEQPPALCEIWSLPARAFGAAELRAAALAPCGGLASDGRWCECVLLLCTERHLLVLGPIAGADGVPPGGSAFSLAEELSAALGCEGAPPQPTSMAAHPSEPLAFIGLDNGGVIMARYSGAAGDDTDYTEEAAFAAGGAREFPSSGLALRLKLKDFDEQVAGANDTAINYNCWPDDVAAAYSGRGGRGVALTR